MGVFKTPKQPDPVATANAQAGANRDGATSSQLINMVDQVTPDGTLKYSQDGTTSFVDSTGKTVNMPKFTATTTLDPLSAEANTLQKQADVGTNRLANTLLGNAQSTLGTPADYSEAAIKARTDAMINPRLADRFAKDEAATRTDLINRGVREGSDAFNNAMLSFNQGKTDAYLSDALGSRQQAIQEIGLGRDRTVNEIGALLGTGQISAPQFVSTPRANVEAAPIAQLINQNYQNRLSGANARMGGLFGLGGSLLSAGAKMAGGF